MSDSGEVFKWRRDFKRIDWRATLVTALLRSACAGLVWFVISLLGQGLQQALPMLAFPLGYLGIMLPIGLAAGWLSGAGIPFVGIDTLLMALAIIPGDALLYALGRYKRDLVPVKKLKFFNFALISFVLQANESIPSR